LIPVSWYAKKWAISAFVLFHLTALTVWNLPNCAIRQRTVQNFAPYMLPTGLWQNWTMFAPDPMRHAFMLQAMAADKNGVMYEYHFPHLVNYSVLDGIARVRHSKYPTYLAIDEYAGQREMTARHVVRALGLPPEVFPVDVELQYLVKEAPPVGQVPDPMVPPKIQPIKAYRFPTWEEARP
jgi:hypothetical protein